MDFIVKYSNKRKVNQYVLLFSEYLMEKLSIDNYLKKIDNIYAIVEIH